ncbi:putative ATPase [Bradyrhizobium sp. i1.7.7]
MAPLAVPPDNPGLTAAAAQTYPALQLFLERAMAGGAQIALDDVNAAIVAGICRKLDGMALAIELAAGRIEAYGLEQTAALLDERLNLLWQGQRTAPPRQKTLQATLDWSYGLLSDTERLVLRRLAVFAGHFTIDAALEIVPDERVDRSRLFDAIDSLVAKSMVAPRPVGAMMRYRLLDTTRAYLLEIEPNETALAARHATHYRRWLEQAGTTWATVPSADERAIHFSALHNVRAALDWCFGTDGDVGIGIALAAAAAPIFLAMSLLIECRRWSERALLAIDPSSRGSAEEMHIQAALGLTLMFTRGGSEAARGALSRSLAIAEARGDAANQLQLLGRMHIFHERMGQFDAALGYAQQSLTVAETLGDAASIALAHSLLGVSLHLAGEHRDALSMLEAAWHGPGTERISTVHGFDHRNRAGISLARELWLQGRPADARQLAQQTVTEAAQMDHPITLCIALIWAVSIDLWSGDLDGAEENLDRFIAHAETRSMGPYLAVGRGVKGELAIRRGDAAGGVETIRACLRELHDAGYELLTTTFNIALVHGLLALGQIERSARLIDDAIGLVEQGGDHLYMPELLRMKGNVSLTLPEPATDEAENHFRQSLDLSRRTDAKAWELRAAIDLAKLIAGRGHARGREEVASIGARRFLRRVTDLGYRDRQQVVGDSLGSAPAARRRPKRYLNVRGSRRVSLRHPLSLQLPGNELASTTASILSHVEPIQLIAFSTSISIIRSHDNGRVQPRGYTGRDWLCQSDCHNEGQGVGRRHVRDRDAGSFHRAGHCPDTESRGGGNALRRPPNQRSGEPGRAPRAHLPQPWTRSRQRGCQRPRFAPG